MIPCRYMYTFPFYEFDCSDYVNSGKPKIIKHYYSNL